MFVAGLALSAVAVWWERNDGSQADQRALDTDPMWNLQDVFQSAVIDRFELEDASFADAVELLNQHAARFSSGSRKLRFVRWKDGDPLPAGLEPVPNEVDSGRPTRMATEPGIPGPESLPVLKPSPPELSDSSHLQLTLTNIPILEASRYVASLAGFVRHAVGDTVWLFPNATAQRIAVTKEYYLLDSWYMPHIAPEIASGSARADLKPWLVNQGVNLRTGDEAYYEAKMSGSLFALIRSRWT